MMLNMALPGLLWSQPECLPDQSCVRCCGETEIVELRHEAGRHNHPQYAEELVGGEPPLMQPVAATRMYERRSGTSSSDMIILTTAENKELPTIVLTADDLSAPKGRGHANVRAASAPQRTSNQSVLRSRNPLTGLMTTMVPASDYVADASDPMDVEVARTLRYIGVKAASSILIRRLAPGRYEIHHRRVALSWGGVGGKDLIAVEEEIQDQSAGAVPLAAYLRQAGTIALETARPVSRYLTFGGPQVNTASVMCKNGHRHESMQRACQQARIREEAAKQYPASPAGGIPVARCLSPQGY